MTNGLRAVIYARYSSRNQTELSIDAQIRQATEFAEKKGYVIVNKYVDQAKSATTDRRPAFRAMIQDSAQGLFDVVLVYKTDRFARNRQDSILYKAHLRKNGIQVVSITENLDGSPESEILESVIEGMAAFVSKDLSRLVKRGMREAAHSCKALGGAPALGFNVCKSTRKYVINEAEAQTVRLIFSMYLAGHGYKKLLSHLNANGIKTKRGKQFNTSALYQILRNPRYYGLYLFDVSSSKDPFGKRNSWKKKPIDQQIRVEGGMPAIISKEDWDKAQELLKRNQRAPGFYKAKTNYLLSGVIHCGECGNTFQGNSRIGGRNKQRHVTYRCAHRAKLTSQCCNREIQTKYLEEFVLDQLGKRLFTEKRIPMLAKKLNAYQKGRDATTSDRLRDLQKTLTGTQHQISNLVAAIADGCDYGGLKAKLRDLEEFRIRTETEIKELTLRHETPVITEGDLRAIIAEYHDAVKTRNLRSVRQFILSYVDRVTIFRDRVEVILKLDPGSERSEGTAPIETVKITSAEIIDRYRHRVPAKHIPGTNQ